MLITYLILITLMLFCPALKIGTNKEYIIPANTLPIKGFWVMVVFFCHYSSYVSLNKWIDLLFIWVNGQVGQICVVMFLFYSGYGIWCSYQNKADYIKTFINKRFLPVWISFAICILLFLTENAFFGMRYDFTEVLLSFTGWTSIGNSNWYMFVTFILYIGFFLCFCLFSKKSQYVKLKIFTFMCLGLIIMLYLTKESWWYNTLLCFPMGMWYSAYKNKIDAFAFESNKNYVFMLLSLIALFLITYLLKRWHGVFFILHAVIFALFTVIATMKLTFRSNPLSFVGKHVFSIYILQRLFFNAGQHYGLNEIPYLFFCLSLIGTILLATLYDYAFEKCKYRFSK